MNRFVTAVPFLLFLANTLNLKAGDTNLAICRVVSHSSSADQNHCGHLVVDGSEKTYWESKPGNNNSVTIDLGASRPIHAVIIHWGANFGTEYHVIALQSNEGDGRDISGAREGKGGVERVDFAEINARFIRIDVPLVHDPIRGCVISEVEVMGTGEDRFQASATHALTGDSLSLNKKIWRIQNARFVADKPEDIAGCGI